MGDLPPAVVELAERLQALGWVRDLLVAGSLATGDHVVGVSDIDLVAVVDGPVDAGRLTALTAVHRGLDTGAGAGADLGCVYVDSARRLDPALRHPTWTHGAMTRRVLSGITRAELVRHGFTVAGRAPRELFPAMSADDVRAAARAELSGYWTWAARRPWLWLDRWLPDLSLTSMARARHTLATGDLLTKTRAVEEAAAPGWLLDQLRARRRGEHVTSPRLRTALIAWDDTRRTISRSPTAPGTAAASGPG